MVVDLFLVYQFVRKLTTPFEKWDAYKLGIIDKDGNVLKKRKTFTRKAETSAFGMFDVMILNIKKLLGKLPGGSSKIASYAAALFLIKEYKVFTDESMLNEDMTDDELNESLLSFNELYSYYITESSNVNTLNELNEAKKIPVKKPPKWKKSGNDGEIEIAFPTGEKYRVEKYYDINMSTYDMRHKGEFLIMKWEDDDWHWQDTVRPKAYAKDSTIWMGQFKGEYPNRKQVVDYSADFKYDHPTAVGEEVDIEEDAPANSVGSGNIAGMDGTHMSKEGQKKWAASNKSKKKTLKDIMGTRK